MATQAKEPANCTSQILFVGNAGIQPTPQADITSLNIDVLASPDFTSEHFETVWLYLKIATAGVTIVSNAVHNPPGNQWSLWDQSVNMWVPTSWPPPPDISTNYLRMTAYNVTLRRGSPALADGATYYFDLKGFPDGGAIEFRAWAEATKITAETESCTIHFSDFQKGQILRGYLS